MRLLQLSFALSSACTFSCVNEIRLDASELTETPSSLEPTLDIETSALSEPEVLDVANETELSAEFVPLPSNDRRPVPEIVCEDEDDDRTRFREGAFATAAALAGMSRLGFKPSRPPGCEDFEGQGSEDEFALTPREDLLAEMIALDVDATFIANQGTYERVVPDLDILREALFQDTENWERDDLPSYVSQGSGRSLTIWIDRAYREALDEGTYDHWDCLNAWYGFEVVGITHYDTTEIDSSVKLRTPALIDLKEVDEAYGELPGVSLSTWNPITFGGGSTLEVTEECGALHYQIDIGWGDCPAGCIFHEYLYYRSTEAGELELMEQVSPYSPAP